MDGAKFERVFIDGFFDYCRLRNLKYSQIAKDAWGKGADSKISLLKNKKRQSIKLGDAILLCNTLGIDFWEYCKKICDLNAYANEQKETSNNEQPPNNDQATAQAFSAVQIQFLGIQNQKQVLTLSEENEALKNKVEVSGKEIDDLKAHHQKEMDILTLKYKKENENLNAELNKKNKMVQTLQHENSLLQVQLDQANMYLNKILSK